MTARNALMLLGGTVTVTGTRTRTGRALNSAWCNSPSTMMQWFSHHCSTPTSNSHYCSSSLSRTIRKNNRNVSAFGRMRYEEGLGESERKKIDVYLDILMDWNENRMNLTAIRDRDDAVQRHINDSLSLLPSLDACSLSSQTDQVSMIDIGSGAGLPGLVIATVRPTWRICVLDSLQKRCTFVSAAVEAMGLENVDVVWSRAEDAGRNEMYREKFTIATARAVAELKVLAELCLPFVTVGGYWVAPKGPRPEKELHDSLRAVSVLGGDVDTIQVSQVDSSAASDDADSQFTVVKVCKTRDTPSAYPRKPGTPKKSPLQ
jgi:16S rRNA (guanine527-N7)-methyltransferase